LALLVLGSLAPRTSYADAFTGKLVDQKGTALAGARVIYQCKGRQAKNRADALLTFSAVAGRDGTFAFNDFPTEASRKLPVTFGVQLPSGHLSIATFRVRGATAIVRDQRTLALFKVTDDHGKGLGGTEIVLRGVAILSPDGSGFFMRQGEFARPRYFKTGPDGTLRVPNLPADLDIFFDCRLAGCPEQFGDFVTTTDHPSKINVTLLQGVTLRGRVTHLGKPASGADVQVTSYTLENNRWIKKFANTKTNAQGIYSVVTPPGSIEIRAKAPGVTPLFAKSLSAGHAAGGTELGGLKRV
jgi:hypothetical protein